jgi:hypothetical protein
VSRTAKYESYDSAGSSSVEDDASSLVSVSPIFASFSTLSVKRRGAVPMSCGRQIAMHSAPWRVAASVAIAAALTSALRKERRERNVGEGEGEEVRI